MSCAVFGFAECEEPAKRLAHELGVPCQEVAVRHFPDGESLVRVPAAPGTAILYRSLDHPNEKIVELLLACSALRGGGARRLALVVPYLAYARKDRQTKTWDPVTTRYVARFFEAVGVDRVATVEVHNLAAYQNAFRCPTEHIDPAPILAEALARDLAGQTVVAVSPDLGGVKRVDHYRALLGRALGQAVPAAVVEKFRSRDVVSGGAVVGDVAGRTAVIIDDMIAGGTTLARAATACREAGALAVIAAAAHGAFVPDASRTLAGAPIDRLYVLDHIPPEALDPAFVEARLRSVDSSRLIADGIRIWSGAAEEPAAAD